MTEGQVADATRVLKELTVSESLHLLQTVSLGRIVFTHRALPAIRPVNHIVHHGDVVIRTHLGAAVMAAAQDGVVVAYEADTIDPRHRLGWSVVVTGIARVVRDPEESARFRELLEPWVDMPNMDSVIRIHAELVTGFELTLAHG